MGNVAKFGIPSGIRFSELGEFTFPQNHNTGLKGFDDIIQRLDRARERLVRTRAMMEETGKTASEILIDTVHTWINQCEMHWYLFGVFEPVGQIENVVYFYTHPNAEGVKIGFSDNLKQRVETLDREQRRSANDVYIRTFPVCYLQCPYHISPFVLERSLHFYHWSHHLEGEWFEGTPVLNWLWMKFPERTYQLMGELGVRS